MRMRRTEMERKLIHRRSWKRFCRQSRRFAMHYLVQLPASHISSQLRKIIRAVRSSPQQRQAWFAEVTLSLSQMEHALLVTALILILDVKTRWSSTHQMLHKLPCYYLTVFNFSDYPFITRTCSRLQNCHWQLCCQEPKTPTIWAQQRGLGCYLSRHKMAEVFPFRYHADVND
jgi:hypothetical protein